ncbi:MDR family NADPH-dependent oxidoreductase [Stieleria varia]|uniref:enoyl-[acyl-carrier-protein] reductase n=1 Tax=Stieleria varia TaxID=2528005 RepID=A0A5C6B3D2_9BACT|nr:2-enoyl thioester reductase domain-containing protein [Stieleria varia]TWU05014.1 Quinone oxidoreductase 1 [Stieleria varia]
MKQIQFSSFGQPSVVARCVDVPEPTAPAAWEVVVKILAFPINVADMAVLAGRYGSLPKLPSTIGMEAAGELEQCGSSVKDLQPGDRVILLANNNWSEKRTVPASAVHKVPSEIDPIQLSMLKVNPATAHIMLTQFEKLEPNGWVIQNAPTGSVGQAVSQLANASGIRTLNIIREGASATHALRFGGTATVVDRVDLAEQVKSEIGPQPLRLALDAIAGAGTNHLASALSEHGTIVNYGMLSGEPCLITPENTIFRNISLRGFWLSKILNRLNLGERTELYSTLCNYLVNGQLKLSVDSCFDITEINDALKRAEQRGRVGKVIVTPCKQAGA